MRALLLSAGVGSRLRPLTLTVPKCLVPIGGIPLLDHWFEHLFRSGMERTLVNTHWLADAVRAHVARSPHRALVDLVHEPELLGTGGTILANRSWFGDGAFLVAHADNVTEFDVNGLIAAHRTRPAGCTMTMLAFRTDTPQECGILELGRGNVVTGFFEKVRSPPGNLANAAVYILEPEVTSFIASLGKPVVDFSTEVIPAFVGRILGFETKGYHRDIGSPQSLAQANLDFAGKTTK